MADKVLYRIEDLLRSLLKVQLGPLLKEHLSSDERREIYRQTGKMTVKQISKKVGWSTGKISGLWSEWEELGLLLKDGKSYRKPFDSSEPD